MAKTFGKRKPPVAKSKSKNGGGSSLNSSGKRRRGRTGWHNGPDTHELEPLLRDDAEMSSPTPNQNHSSPGFKKFPTPVKKHHPKWEPMAHTCGVCYSKTTSEKFKRTCFNKHEFVCDRFHRTLLRAGRQEHCSACVMEKEMDEKRRAEMKTLLEVIESLMADIDHGGGCGNRKTMSLKTYQAKYDSLSINFFEVRANTERELQDRKEGFFIWKAS